MKLRSVAFGAALTFGGLAGVAGASHDALELPESSLAPNCEDFERAKLCSSLGKPVEAYVAVIANTNIAGRSEAGSDMLRVKLSALASGAGSLVLLCAACQQVAESWPPQTRRIAG